MSCCRQLEQTPGLIDADITDNIRSMRASISVAGDADRVEAGRQIVQRGAVPYDRIVQADGAGYGLRNIAPYPIKETANRGGLSCKHDNQRNSDQGVHASNRHAETKIGHDAFGLELDLLPVQCTFPADCPAPKVSIRSGPRQVHSGGGGSRLRFALSGAGLPVCTENSNPDVMTVKPAEDRV